MAYLTAEETSNLFTADSTTDKQKEFIDAAEAVLDNVTQHFYRFNDIEKDVPFRRDQFKKALMAQIKYFSELGTTSLNQIRKTPDSFSVGRTSITNGSSEGGKSRSHIAPDVTMYLEGTGLLYRGGSSWG